MMVPGKAKVAVTFRVTNRLAIDIISATSGLSSVDRPTSLAPSESEGYFYGSAIYLAIYGATNVTGQHGAVRGSLPTHVG
jgi:hypothetical protein